MLMPSMIRVIKKMIPAIIYCIKNASNDLIMPSLNNTEYMPIVINSIIKDPAPNFEKARPETIPTRIFVMNTLIMLVFPPSNFTVKYNGREDMIIAVIIANARIIMLVKISI